jgi:hypothetical protein
MDEYMTPTELAALLKRPGSTLAKWRQRQVGPPHVKVVGGIRYRRSDVEAWLLASTSQQASR